MEVLDEVFDHFRDHLIGLLFILTPQARSCFDSRDRQITLQTRMHDLTVIKETKLMSIKLGVMPFKHFHVTPNPHWSLSSQHFPLLILLLAVEFICLLIPPPESKVYDSKNLTLS